MSHVPKRWLPSRLFVWESQEVTKSQRNNFFICSRVPYQSSQTPLSVGLWYTQDWPFIFKTRNLAEPFCPTPWGDVMAQTSSRSSWARCGETSSTGSLNQGQFLSLVVSKNSPRSQCSPGKNAVSWGMQEIKFSNSELFEAPWFTFNGWIRLVSSGMIETFSFMWRLAMFYPCWPSW